MRDLLRSKYTVFNPQKGRKRVCTHRFGVNLVAAYQADRGRWHAAFFVVITDGQLEHESEFAPARKIGPPQPFKRRNEIRSYHFLGRY